MTQSSTWMPCSTGLASYAAVSATESRDALTGGSYAAVSATEWKDWRVKGCLDGDSAA
jgi:hypothetical protein